LAESSSVIVQVPPQSVSSAGQAPPVELPEPPEVLPLVAPPLVRPLEGDPVAAVLVVVPPPPPGPLLVCAPAEPEPPEDRGAPEEPFAAVPPEDVPRSPELDRQQLVMRRQATRGLTASDT
jgi:hypothetical protein